MTVSQAILASINGAAGGGGGGSKYAAWDGIYLDPMNEGQENTFTVSYGNWDGSTIYWNIIAIGDNPASLSDFNVSSGSYTPDAQSGGLLYFNFTALADATIEGNQTYTITVGSSDGGTDIADGTQGTYTIRDTSQNPQLILDLDPALYDAQGYPTSWIDSSNRSTPAILYNTTYSTDGGGSFVFNGTNAYAEVPLLQPDWRYPNATVSIWFKEDTEAVAAVRALISKELIFKLEMMDDGFIRMLANGKGYAPWDADVVSNGSEHFRHGQWNNLTFTRTDQDAGFVYLNGVEFMSFSGGLYGSNSFPFIIGGYSDGGAPAYLFQGNIAQVKMWNYARTPQQIWETFGAEVNRYIPQLPEFDLQWNNTHNAFYDPAHTSLSVTINSATASVEDNGMLASGLVWPGTSGDYIDIEGVNYIQSTFTLSIVAKFNIDPNHYNTVFDGSKLDRIGNGVWANVWADQFSVGTQDQNYGLNDMTAYPNNEIAWWDFVFTPTSVALYKNGLPVGSSTTTPQGKLWYDNLRIAAEYNQAGNTMAGVYYRFKYQKTALSATNIILQFNANCGLYDLPPVPLSLSFNGTSSYLEVAGNTGDWALGDDYTIEWWQKPNDTSFGYIMSASNNPADVHNCIDIDTQYGNVYGSRRGFGQGTLPSNIWNHVAIVNTGGIHKIYFNGVQVYAYNAGPNSSYSLTDTYSMLRIGSGAGSYPGYYAGKLTGIRVSDRVLYTSAFVPSVNPYLAGSTKLLLNVYSAFTDYTDYQYGGAQVFTTTTEAGGITYLKLDTGIDYSDILIGITAGDTVTTVINSAPSDSIVAADPFNDGTRVVVPVLTSWWETTSNATIITLTHTPRRISNVDVSLSQDVPTAVTGLQHPFSGGTFGSFYALYGDPNLMNGVIQSIPVGAAVTSNIPGFGVRTVTWAGQDITGWRIQYDFTGLTGSTSTSDVFNFYW